MILRKPSVLIFLSALALVTIVTTLMAQAGLVSTSFVKLLGKTLCLAIAALAMDLVWGFTGILSLGHFAFFGIGGYAIGMWLMWDRTENIVMPSLTGGPLPPTPFQIEEAIGTQIFGVVGSSDVPWLWSLSLWLFQNDSGLRGNNGLSGLQNIPGLRDVAQSVVSLWFLWASAIALALAYLIAAWTVSGRFGSVLRGIRDDEARVRFLGYEVEHYKLAVFTGTAMVTGLAGALYYPQAGIVNPAEIAPIASIYLAVWVAIGGRGRLYGAVIGAAVVSLASSWFTGGGAPAINLGFYVIKWTDWWLVLLGLSFVLVTLFAPKGLGGLVDLWTGRRARGIGPLGPDQGSLRGKEEVA